MDETASDSKWRDLVKRDQFLQKMLASAEAANRTILEQVTTREELILQAKLQGYRTVTDWQAMRADGLSALRNFAASKEFECLWKVLRKHDASNPFIGYSYSPANGGVPMRLLRAIEVWHQAPKITRAERNQISKAIGKKCHELENLLAQLDNGGSSDKQFSQFLFQEEGQSRAILKAFQRQTGHPSGDSSKAGLVLALLGVEPIRAVKNIKLLAMNDRLLPNTLPTKVRAKAAKKTYFIGVVRGAICASTQSTLDELGIGPQMMADLVALLSDMDCTSDDVRKVLGEN
jgi:hypothetical protein